jgi:two-component sensor histidine kinase
VKGHGFLGRKGHIARLRDELALEREARARADAFIAETLEERNLLLGEIHHRVKNNLQVIVSILRLQAGRAADASVKEALQRALDRVQTISAAHERLYKSSDFRSADASAYFRDLVSFLGDSLRVAGGSDVEFALDVDPVPLDTDRCINCGLIINELVTNAVKHAFPDDGEGKPRIGKRVTITMKAVGAEYALSVADNGTGMARENLEGNRGSLGMRMVHSLAHQLRAHLEYSSEGGSTFRLRFKAAEPDSSAQKSSSLRRIRQAIAALPEKNRALATRYYLDGRSIEELVEAMGVDRDVLTAKLRSLRMGIRDALLAEGARR